MIRKAISLIALTFSLCTLGTAAAQVQPTPNETAVGKQIDKIDLSVSGVGQYNTTVQGPILPSAAPDYGTTMTQFGSNTLGALVGLRYVGKPYFGLEFNYGYARYTENFNVAPGQIQTRASEYTFGYVVNPPHPLFGLQPFAAGGAGSLAFKPTAHGGQGAPEQARAVYYYALGLQKDSSSGHFGIRAGFRQIFFLAPDFGQNYLTILKHTTTYEPMVGFYLRY